MYRKFRRFCRIVRYIVREVRIEIRAMLRNPKITKFLLRGFRICFGLSTVFAAIELMVDISGRPVPEDCGGLLLAIPFGIAFMFKS